MSQAIVLTYHNIGTPPGHGNLHSLYVTSRMFKFQMWYLKASGFKVVPLHEIISFMKGNISGKKLVAITFDDGYQDFYENAYPVLKMFGYPSTVFLVTDLIGKENLWDYRELNIRKRLLDWDKIVELRDHRVVFGSHTKTHPFLSKLSTSEIEDELFGSKTALEKKMGFPVELFCYPYGDYDDRVVTTVKKAGYLGAATMNRGFIRIGDDPFEIRRLFVRLNTHPLLFMIKLHSTYEDRKGLRI